MTILSDIKATGTTQVLVTLKGVAPGDSEALAAHGSQITRLRRNFAAKEHSQASMLAAIAGKRGKRASPVRVYPNLGLMLGTVDERGYVGLRKDPAVHSVVPAPALSLIRPVEASECSATKRVAWGLTRLRIPEVWDTGLSGRGVVVGHLDTGVDAAHPALQGAIAAFAHFDLDGDPVPGARPSDSGEHGTHTAGTIVGRAVGSTRFGVAPGAQLACALVIEGGNVIARILGGMDWIVGQGARILSMSLGLRGYREDFLPLMQAIRNRGVLPVVAVGNEYAGTSRSPGNYEVVLSVGACDEREEVAAFSSSQWLQRPKQPLVPDLVAPGDGVLSALPGGRYGTMNGTSMATPHVAGLAALLWEAVPHATVDQVEQAILDSCTRPASMPEARANRGVPDAVRAVALLRGATQADSGSGSPTARTTARTTATRKKKAKKRSRK